LSAEGSSPAVAGATNPEGVRAEVGDIPAIEGLRGVAVLWVMLFHYLVLRDGRLDDAFVAFVKSWLPVEVFVRNGYLGVDLFFLITGFLLTLPWFRHADAGLAAPDWRRFYLRRARRILPAYYVQLALLFFVALPLLHPSIWMESTLIVLQNLGAHFTFLHYTNPVTSASLTVNGALWTLAIEMQYYLLVPLVAPLFVRWPWRSLAGAFAIAAGWRWLAANDLHYLVAAFLKTVAHTGVQEADIRHLLGTQLPAWSLHFALGILAGRAWMLRDRAITAALARGLAPAIALASLVGLYFVLRHGTGTLGQLGWTAVPLLIAAAFVVILCGPPGVLPRSIASWPLAALGKISYSAYLYHLPVLLLFNAFAPAAGGLVALPLWVATVVLVSAASYRYVERPFLRSRAAGVDPQRLREHHSA